MKKILLAFIAVFLFATPLSASSYVSGSVGVGFIGSYDATEFGVRIDDAATFKVGVPIVGAFGTQFGQNRIEAAIGYQKNDVDKVKVDLVHQIPVFGMDMSTMTYMVNAYHDFDLGTGISPYITAGTGVATITTSAYGLSESSTVFTWQAGAGIGFKASSNLTVDLGYRYIRPSEVTDSFGGTATGSSNNFLAGLRYNF